MKLFWISWHQPTCDSDGDHRPLNFPPREEVLGWWCTGTGGSYETQYSVLCAYVVGESEQQVKQLLQKDWPETKDVEWRFCEQRDKVIESDRFPPGEWMQDRLAKYK